MLAQIVRASLQSPRIVTALACLVAILGAAAVRVARFDVFPDFAPPHVLVQTEAPGLDAAQVEALVTRPLEGLLAGTENVKAVRSTSSQGLSAIQVVFDRSGDPYRQRQVVTERLAEFAGLLPRGVGAPLLSPLSSSMEYLVHFGYTSDTLSPLELRDLVQWFVKPQIMAVPGVAQAQIFGGELRERQIRVDPVKMAAARIDLDEVIVAARRAGESIGGGYLETPLQRIIIDAPTPAQDVLHVDHGIVDHDAEGDHEAAERHRVQAESDRLEQPDRRQQGERNRAEGHQGSAPVPQRHEQQRDDQHGPDEQGVAQFFDGALDEARGPQQGGMILDPLPRERGRECIEALFEGPCHFERIRTELRRGLDEDPRLAGDQRCAETRRGGVRHLRDVGEPNRQAAAGRDHGPAERRR